MKEERGLEDWNARSISSNEMMPLVQVVEVTEATDRLLTLTETRADTNNVPLRRVSRVQTADGRVIVQEFDFESQPEIIPAPPKLPTRAEVMRSAEFLLACKAAEIEPTPRQAAKYAKQQGKAWRARNLASPLPEGRAKRAHDDEEV